MGDRFNVIFIGDGNVGGDFRLAKGHHVCTANPQHTAQRNTDHQGDCQPDDGCDQMGDTQKTV
ncbi:MAG: hypothetical protein IIU97_06470, partial [Bacteroidaceae bacterium]|nr:hypothetical protein [Bacteroidaceae bacterium]